MKLSNASIDNHSCTREQCSVLVALVVCRSNMAMFINLVFPTSYIWILLRSQAAYPLPYLRESKLWPSVGKINDVYGDKNLVAKIHRE